MQQEGRADQEIVSVLVGQGFPAKDVQESLAQAKIKSAVMEDSNSPSPVASQSQTPERLMPSVLDSSQPQQPDSQAYSAMDQAQSQQYSQQENYPPQDQSPYNPPALPPAPASNYPYGDYPQQEYQQPQDQQDYSQQPQESYSYPQGISIDTINEISEQVITEKLSPIKNKIEEISSFKNVIESKMDHLDERLKRIEKTIDRLQLSVLQKVGDYMTNVEDIKKELIETQKTFKAALSSPKPKALPT